MLLHCLGTLPTPILMSQLLSSPRWTPRGLASLAGQLVFAYQAVALAPVLVRTLHQVLVGRLAWDVAFPPSDLSREQVRHAMEFVRAFNGLRLFKRMVAVMVGPTTPACTAMVPS